MLFCLLLLLEFVYNVFCALSHPVEWAIVRVGNVARRYQGDCDALWRMLLAVPGWLLLSKRGQLGDVGTLGFGSWLFP
ncbi:unnamed protein product [Absidia cylindrospora]